MSTIAFSRSHVIAHAWKGVVAGLAGGIVFGMLMAMTGMLPMIAMMVGSQSAVVGGLVHLVISAGIGLVFGVLAGGFADRLWPVLGAGLVYGLVWWVLGGLALMPAFLGMPVFTIDQTAMMSLMGHAVYGIVAALALWGLSRGEEH
ncbi:hypothetical protein O4J56_02965 [Nocardiopsis sp. RSe5-2]|uniref:DUF1440 domain-containing protein n=1 Tax=Nocardiopsis endophytica TaxID=3018445 RepID=A0ABT4TY19_9ACTN|nr:hypothetical protein [Nocardiopsis endophytica]MDA2809591.1 hypothetical protein [Nocardiopsis endophytica]